MKNTLHFIIKAPFVFKIFKFLSSHFGDEVKRLDKKDQVNIEIHDVTAWLTNNYNTHIAQNLTN